MSKIRTKDMLPTKDETISKGYYIARYGEYTHRRVLTHHNQDTYYSGWMDCFDWITNKNIGVVESEPNETNDK